MGLQRAVAPDHPALVRVLREAELEARAGVLAPLASLVIELAPADGTPRTRLGGQPVLPEGAAWPAHRWRRWAVERWPDDARGELYAALERGEVVGEPDGFAMPLRFVGVIELASVAAVAPTALPPDGSLYLFLSVRTAIVDDDALPSRVAAAALYAPKSVPRVPHEHPREAEGPLAGVAYLAPRLAIAWADDTWDRASAVLDEAELARLSRAQVLADEAHQVLPAATVEAGGPMPPPGHTAIVRLADRSELGLAIGDASWATWIVPDAELAARRFDQARASVFVG